MASIEFRRAPSGAITAVRAKVRRVGLPHLSKTFPVAGEARVADARAAALAWAESTERALCRTTEQPPPAHDLPRTTGRLAAAWARAAASPERASGHASRAAARTAGPIASQPPALDPVDRALLALRRETGCSMEELRRLRWQHLSLDLPGLALPGPSGVPRGIAPISAATLDALLALPGRKQGLLFKMAPAALERRLRALSRAVAEVPAAAAGQGPDAATLRR